MKTVHLKLRPVRASLAIAVFCLLGIQHAVASDTKDVVVTPSKTSVQVAEPFWLEMSVTAPKGASVTFPSTGERIGSFDVIDTQDVFDVPSADKPDQRVWTRKVQLENVDTGEQVIPSLDIQVADRESNSVVKTQPLAVRVVSVLEDRSDPTQYRDIQSVVDVVENPPRSSNWAWLTLAGCATLAVTIAAVVAMVRRKPWMTPSEWAFAKLDQLEDSIASGPTDSEDIAVEISNIARDYLQLQFSLSQPGRTTSEMLNTLRSERHFDDAIAAKLEALFELADRVKFAGIQLSDEAWANVASDLRRIISSITGNLESQPPRTNKPETH